MDVKVAIIGDDRTGKTSFCRHIAREPFNEEYVPTQGADQYSKTFPGDEDFEAFSLNINDISGANKFAPLVPSHVRPAHIVLLFFDLCNLGSFNNLEKDYLTNTSIFPKKSSTSQLRFLVGTKTDSPNLAIKQKAIDALVQKFDLTYFPISSKSGDGIAPLLDFLKTNGKEILSSSPSLSPQLKFNKVRLLIAKKKYESSWKYNKTGIENIQTILSEYSRGDSWLNLLLHCNLCRNHTQEINAIVKEINDNKYTTTNYQDLLIRLDKIPKSATGSLARRLAFIKNKLGYNSDYANEYEPEESSGCFRFV